MKTKTEIKIRAQEWMKENHDADVAHWEGFVEGYTEAQKEMMKYKKAFDILNCYYDSISDEERPKIHKKLTRLGL